MYRNKRLHDEPALNCQIATVLSEPEHIVKHNLRDLYGISADIHYLILSRLFTWYTFDFIKS